MLIKEWVKNWWGVKGREGSVGEGSEEVNHLVAFDMPPVSTHRTPMQQPFHGSLTHRTQPYTAFAFGAPRG